MGLILLIVILLLLFGGGGGYYAHQNWGRTGTGRSAWNGVVLVLWLLGGVR